MGEGDGDSDLLRLREVCLALPEAAEDGGVGAPSFKVRGKIFAMRHGHQGRPSLWCKAERGLQEQLVAAEPARFFVPPYVGHHGWVGIWLDAGTDWGGLAALVRASYRITAPKRLAALAAGPARDGA